MSTTSSSSRRRTTPMSTLPAGNRSRAGDVVDKPLAPTSGARGELIDRADTAASPLTVFHNRRWDSDQLTLRRLIREGSLGDVRRYESRFERWLPRVRGKAWETTSPEGRRRAA